MPTENQKAVFLSVAEKVRKGVKVSISAEMRKAGYSECTSKHPNKLTESDGWKELLDKYCKDEDIAKTLQEGMKASKTVSAITGKDANAGTVDFIDVPDYSVRHKYLETAVKLKGKVPKENEGGNVNYHLHLEQERQEYVQD